MERKQRRMHKISMFARYIQTFSQMLTWAKQQISLQLFLFFWMFQYFSIMIKVQVVFSLLVTRYVSDFSCFVLFVSCYSSFCRYSELATLSLMNSWLLDVCCVYAAILTYFKTDSRGAQRTIPSDLCEALKFSLSTQSSFQSETS